MNINHSCLLTIMAVFFFFSIPCHSFSNQVNIFDMVITPSEAPQAGVPLTVTVTASNPDGHPVYYKFYYCANYGTSAYATTPWTVVQEYSTANSCTYIFPSAGDYIVVVRAVTHPNEEPENLPITGQVIHVNSNDITPVYVTVAGHIEDNANYANCSQYPEYRSRLLIFADLMQRCGIPFELQIDYELFMGALRCETPEMMAETGGTNVIDYIATHYDFRIDPHQSGGWEEGMDNYADVRFIGGQVTSRITDNVGGVVWDQIEQFERFNNGETGKIHTDFKWFPKILTMGVHTRHHLGDFTLDDLTSGIWKPSGFGNDFLTHHAGNRMVYIGPGMQHSNWFTSGKHCFRHSVDYVEVLVDYLDKGKIPAQKMYTCTIAVPQTVIFDESLHHLLVEQFEQIDSLVKEGRVVYSHFSEIVTIWQEKFNSEANIFLFENIDPSDYTADE